MVILTEDNCTCFVNDKYYLICNSPYVFIKIECNIDMNNPREEYIYIYNIPKMSVYAFLLSMVPNINLYKHQLSHNAMSKLCIFLLVLFSTLNYYQYLIGSIVI